MTGDPVFTKYNLLQLPWVPILYCLTNLLTYVASWTKQCKQKSILWGLYISRLCLMYWIVSLISLDSFSPMITHYEERRSWSSSSNCNMFKLEMGRPIYVDVLTYFGRNVASSPCFRATDLIVSRAYISLSAARVHKVYFKAISNWPFPASACNWHFFRKQ